MTFREKIIEQKIKRLWSKTYNTQSEAHFRAEEITRLEKLKNKKSWKV